MAYSIFGASANARAARQGCSTADSCTPYGTALSRLQGLFSLPIGNQAANGSICTATEIAGVKYLDATPYIATVNNVSLAGTAIAQIGAAFRRSDAPDFAEYAQTVVSTSATPNTYTTVAALEVDRMFTIPGAPVGTRALRFGWLLKVTVPQNVLTLRVSDDGAAGATATYSARQFNTVNCLTTWIYIPTRDTTILYGGNAVLAADPTQLRRLLPAPGVGGLLAPGGGTPKLVGFMAFDITGAQVAAPLQIEYWGVQVTTNTVTAFLNGLTPSDSFSPSNFTVEAGNMV